MTERSKILKDYFKDLKEQQQWCDKWSASFGEDITNYYGGKAYEKWAKRNGVKITIFCEETQMQKLWKNTIRKIHGTFHSIRAWCARNISLS